MAHGRDLAALQRCALIGVFLPVRSDVAMRVLARVLPNVGSAGMHLDRLVRDMIRQRRAVLPVDERGDLLDLLVAAGRDGGLDDGEIRDEVMTLLLAGYETTSAAGRWCCCRATRWRVRD